MIDYAAKLLRENRELRTTLALREEVIKALRATISNQNTVRHFLAASTVRNQNSASISKPADAGAASPHKSQSAARNPGHGLVVDPAETPTSRSHAEAPLT